MLKLYTDVSRAIKWPLKTPWLSQWGLQWVEPALWESKLKQPSFVWLWTCQVWNKEGVDVRPGRTRQSWYFV